jgi:hypothetical protein
VVVAEALALVDGELVSVLVKVRVVDAELEERWFELEAEEEEGVEETPDEEEVEPVDEVPVV